MNIGPHLASKFPSTTKAFNLYITPAISVFQLTCINPSDVLDLLKNWVTNKSAGLDRIPNKLLKVAGDSIAEPLRLLFNNNTCMIHEKLLDSDWLRAVQFKCNTNAKSITPVQITHRNSGL